MGQNSKIEWCHHTFNMWRGCTKATWTDSTGKARLHPGCLNCYAEKDRSVRMHGIRWGKGQERVPKAESGWAEPLAWARAAARAGERHRVFCASLADVLDPEVPDSMRERLWDTIRATAFVLRDGTTYDRHDLALEALQEGLHAPGLDWLLLTKRPEEWQRIPADVRPLVWGGTSISDQETAEEWVKRLLAAEGFRYRFLSVEPLVGPVDLRGALGPSGGVPGHCVSIDGDRWHAPGECKGALENCSGRCCSRGIDWVIVGGESGPKARPLNVEWVRDIVRQCREAGVPCFVKQLGSVWAKANGATTTDEDGKVVPDKKGGDWKNWPEDLRVRELPEARR